MITFHANFKTLNLLVQINAHMILTMHITCLMLTVEKVPKPHVLVSNIFYYLQGPSQGLTLLVVKNTNKKFDAKTVILY